MNANIKLQGTAITFAREDIEAPDGAYRLLADLAEAVSIPPGRFATIPTPIWVQGDGAAVALIHVQAGRAAGATSAATGQYLIPSTDEQQRIVAIVFNETTSTIVVNPKNAIGFVEFSLLGGERGEGQEEPANAGSDDVATGMPIPTVYRPRHIDAETHPAYASVGAAAFDLRADLEHGITIPAGGRALIQTGLSMAIPAGHEGQIRPRSGLAVRHGIGITNSPATIDSDYRGEIGVVLQNHGSEPFAVEPGDRIAQMLIAPFVRAALDFRSDLDDTIRGGGGFGSTGRR